MSEDITKVGLPDAATMAVARLICPDAFEAFDRRAGRKGWGPQERAMELAERLNQPSRTGNAIRLAGEILAHPAIEAVGLARAANWHAAAAASGLVDQADFHEISASTIRGLIRVPDDTLELTPEMAVQS